MKRKTMSSGVRRRYEAALDSLVQKLKEDRYVVAVILCGSLSHDEVWEKSDIDLVVVATDDLKENKDFSLVEDDISIHAMLFPRGKFKAQL